MNNSRSMTAAKRRRVLAVLRLVLLGALVALVDPFDRGLPPLIWVILAAHALTSLALWFQRDDPLSRRRPGSVLVLFDLAVCAGVLGLVRPDPTNAVLAFFLVVLLSALGRSVAATILVALAGAAVYLILALPRMDAPSAGLDLLRMGSLLLASALFATYVARTADEERRRRTTVEEELRRLRDRLQTVAGLIPEAIVFADPPDRILEMNPAAERLFGRRADDARGKPLSLLVAPAAHGALDGALRAALADPGQPPPAVELCARRPDGAEIPVELSLAAAPAGEVAVLAVVFRDVADRTREEAALRESNRRMEQDLHELRAAQERVVREERAQAIQGLARGLAHDLNNALSPIIGFAELLLLRPGTIEDKDRVRKYVETIYEAAQDAAGTVRRLRAFYRKRAPDETVAPVNLSRVVQDAITAAEPRRREAPGAIRFETSLEPSPLVEGNEPELREAVENVIANAVDAMPEGGTVSLRVRAEGHVAVLEVADAGCGMTEDVRRRCTEPFFTTKGPQRTGLGLAVVHGAVTRHGGQLEIKSAPGAGTTVALRFPLASRGAPAAPAPERPARLLRILVAEDDPRVREVVRAYLAGDGHAVEPAPDGEQAWERFQAGRFDVVIADRAMPGMAGAELARRVKERSPATSVILLTGLAEAGEFRGPPPTGIDLVIAKPTTLAELRAALARLVP